MSYNVLGFPKIIFMKKDPGFCSIFLKYLCDCKVRNDWFGESRIMKSEVFGFPEMNPKNYLSKMKQNNYTELLGYSSVTVHNLQHFRGLRF